LRGAHANAWAESWPEKRLSARDEVEGLVDAGSQQAAVGLEVEAVLAAEEAPPDDDEPVPGPQRRLRARALPEQAVHDEVGVAFAADHLHGTHAA
jgi:hypothetical protein